MAPHSVRESSWVWALSRETLRQAVLWGQKFITRVIHATEDSSTIGALKRVQAHRQCGGEALFLEVSGKGKFPVRSL